MKKVTYILATLLLLGFSLSPTPPATQLEVEGDVIRGTEEKGLRGTQ